MSSGCSLVFWIHWSSASCWPKASIGIMSSCWWSFSSETKGCSRSSPSSLDKLWKNGNVGGGEEGDDKKEGFWELWHYSHINSLLCLEKLIFGHLSMTVLKWFLELLMVIFSFFCLTKLLWANATSQNALRLSAVTVFYSSELTNCQLSLSWSWGSEVWDKLWKTMPGASNKKK